MSSTVSPSSLEALPDQLLIRILEIALTQHELQAVCLVSRRINAIADPILYRSILFDQPKHYMTFSSSLVNRPRRGSLIQNVRLEYPSSKLSEIMHVMDSTNRIDKFASAISTMSNLETLVISIPDSLCSGIGILFNHPFYLACLKSCKLCC